MQLIVTRHGRFIQRSRQVLVAGVSALEITVDHVGSWRRRSGTTTDDEITLVRSLIHDLLEDLRDVRDGNIPADWGRPPKQEVSGGPEHERTDPQASG